MDKILRGHAEEIMRASIQAVQTDGAVRRALEGRQFPGQVVLVAAGKAAWQMAKAAYDCLGGTISRGAVVTKYGHVKGPIGPLVCCEGGHPVPDENSFAGTERALAMVEGLTAEDTVLFLLSGGGSALFEKPLVSGEALRDVTDQLLACGADIVEMNTIRKRLSAVKGGRFAQLCAPAQVFTIVLRSRLSRQLHLRPGQGHRGEISSAADGGDGGAAGPGDSQGAGQRDHPDHRQRPPAVRGGGGRLPAAGL